ncbi:MULTISPECIES: GNAT family N-acetyltransferase [unclassified Streptomyces]|uniref:GNAT family N-acetyltransferase n=1 Tax=unclassified Streptomyces TaxID=2593676 RepID=UPI000699BE90|nr:GNAT family N-acetyltransferase [Streptomyces sp. CNQ-509]
MPSARGVQVVDIGDQRTRYLKLEVRSLWGGPQAPEFFGRLRVDEIQVAHGRPAATRTGLPLEAEARDNRLQGGAREAGCDACSGARLVAGLGGGEHSSVTYRDVRAPAAVGWVGIGDRAEYPRLQRSPVTRALDDTPVWVITCLFVIRGHRRRGLQTKMISAACDFAAEHGRHTVEAFPVAPAPGRTAGADNAMTGIASAWGSRLHGSSPPQEGPPGDAPHPHRHLTAAADLRRARRPRRAGGR